MKAEELFGMSQDRLAELQKMYQQSGEKGLLAEGLGILPRGVKAAAKIRKYFSVRFL